MMISSDGVGNYTCGDCGHKWKARHRYQWWPIRVLWRPRTAHKFFAWHGWQTGWDGIEQRVYGQTFHVGALKIHAGG
jgi:hypothetical protein